MNQNEKVFLVIVASVIIISTGGLRLRENIQFLQRSGQTLIGMIFNSTSPRQGASFSNTGDITYPPGMGVSDTPPDLWGLDVYEDLEGTTKIISIEWGTLYPGESKTEIIYLNNYGTYPMKLSMTTLNWTPKEAEEYITVTWDLEETDLAIGEYAMAQITISIDPTVKGVTDFSFDISLSG
jgi:hypothetical protein